MIAYNHHVFLRTITPPETLIVHLFVPCSLNSSTLFSELFCHYYIIYCIMLICFFIDHFQSKTIINSLFLLINVSDSHLLSVKWQALCETISRQDKYGLLSKYDCTKISLTDNASDTLLPMTLFFRLKAILASKFSHALLRSPPLTNTAEHRVPRDIVTHY